MLQENDIKVTRFLSRKTIKNQTDDVFVQVMQKVNLKLIKKKKDVRK